MDKRNNTSFFGARPFPSGLLKPLVGLAVVLLALVGCSEQTDAPPAQEPPTTESPGQPDPTDTEGVNGASLAHHCSPDNTRTLRMSSSTNSLVFLPYFIAENQGFLADEGLDVERIAAGGGNVPGLVSGETDLIEAPLTTVINLRNEGRDAVIIGSTTNRAVSHVIIQGSIAEEAGYSEDWDFEQRAELLRDARIGTTSPGSATDIFIRAVFEDAGMDAETDAEIIFTDSGGNMLAAFAQGQIDAMVLSPPTSTLAVLEHGGVSFLLTTRGDYPALADPISFTSVIAMESWLSDEENRIAAGCLLRAMDRAIRYIQSNPDQALEIAIEVLELDDVDLAAASFDDTFPAYPPTVRIDPADAQRSYEFDARFRSAENPLEDHLDLTIAEDFLDD